ncbi:hypothetical protein N657DRAFT_681456 [Parathielavia appendiculata]|uniref:RRM domain-containing protein n=1 Tax=Parathielavia appendiculata TaxID=2587402 RepID=A0AAN6Z2Y6_9PEZI|nr:hypothetical protein N657DRAFT_681456 [Parathielavia appendiculata]
MHRHHQHNRHLETYTVEPGTETGLYYILVANLAHRTTWRDLKAFASQACEVDHAEVYPPTSGFVRVKGRANFEKAIRYLDGNTLEYRALQADGRNLNQPTVVKLPPNDFHAERIRRGGSVRVFDEPDAPALDPNVSPEPFSHGTSAGSGNSYLDYQGSASSALDAAPQADVKWRYVMASSYVPDEDYQPAMPSTTLISSGPMAYQVMAPSNHGFIWPVATGPLPTSTPSVMYRTAPGPLSVITHPAAAQYDASASNFPPGAAYSVEGQTYARYYQRPPEGTSYLPWLPDAAASAPSQLEQIVTTTTSRNIKEQPGAAAKEQQRKIVIYNLERENLSEAVVMSHLVRLTGIDTATPGQVEKIELSASSSGRPRAFVTFSAAGLAAAAVASLDGCVVGGSKLSARVLGEGSTALGGVGGGSRRGRRMMQSKPSSGAGASLSRFGKDAGGLSKPSHSQGHPSSLGASGSLGSSGSSASMAVAVREAGVQEKNKKEERPVIVDGSGGRWKRKMTPVVVDGSAGGRKVNGGERGAR